MLFGSISYLNLLPFQLFLKRYLRSNAAQMAFRYKRAVPSRINASLRRGEVNAAFISSVHSPRFACTDLGIIAKGAVYSVFVLPEADADDPASATSNRLAHILGLHGRVLIGDAALRYYLEGGEGIDLAKIWEERTGLPFVFARLCYNRHGTSIKRLAHAFTRSHTRIPQYILKREATKRGITPAQLTWYLQHIHYEMDWRTKRGLKRFLGHKHSLVKIHSSILKGFITMQTRDNFLRKQVREDLASGKYSEVVTRFPPEPNGFPHIGHAKSIALNFGIAREFGGHCNLRMDDTNPTTEDTQYVQALKDAVEWLGFEWGDKVNYTSDYFPKLYEYAVQLIKMGKAYVDSLDEETMRAYRGTVTEPGRRSEYAERSIEENLDLFARMKAGEFPDGAHVLRAKIDMASPNMKLRDPLLYRIRHAHHFRAGDAWAIYPMYDFAHCLSDYIEGVTHSICTLEFENNRPVYDWVLDTLQLEPPRPYQHEFAV